ncbi:MAG: heparinase II/III family protein [Armatimonadetes bacterium]|nr:heparinase II/III family protein [Armatimonadota bacterium]
MTSERFDPTDLSLWERYRGSVRRPATFIKPADLAVAKENIARHDWARRLLASYRSGADYVLSQPDGYIESMISETTPLCTLFTMCPHYEYAPIHGQYSWDVKRPDELKCRGCGTVYPNAQYPEDLVLTAHHGGEQRFTFHGGKGWLFNNITLRSSWSGAIRAYKNHYMARAARSLAISYALTGEAAYAAGATAILSRFATVYPRYLIHSGYGEIADLEPRIAAQQINALPVDELTCPPNTPDRKLHAGYWMAGRGFSAVGMEGGHLADLAEAYDLVAETIPDPERLRIERDLLLEASYLLLADQSLNNKTATNRSAVGEVGLAVGEPRFVRFALSGLRWFIDEWYLPDGAASESPAYGNMTLGGIWRFADSLHGYSDPAGYDPPGGRLDNLDIYGEARYRSVFQVLADALLPNLKYPPIADSQPETGLSQEIAEVMAARYGGRFRDLLRELTGGLEKRGGEWALFHRDPGLTDAGPAPVVALPDVYFPAWRMAYLRSGANGRRGAAVVSASEWGGHHHWDSLNLFYWQDGHELLTDLGYLWDNPDKHHLAKTSAHNLVVVDEAEQRTEGRGGQLHRFAASPAARLVEVSSTAYPQTSEYRRTVFLVDQPDGAYLVDLFRVSGGTKHDYLFHGPNPEVTLHGFEGGGAPDLKPYGVTGVRRRQADSAPWTATWALPEGYSFQALSLPEAGETAHIGVGWGQRTPAQKGLQIPYVVRRREATAPLSSAFVSLFEGYRGQPLAKAAARLETGVPGGLAVAVERADGGRDYLWALPEGARAKLPTSAGELLAEGHGVLSTHGEKLRFAWLVGGGCLEWGSHRLSLPQPRWQGRVTAAENAGQESWLALDQELPTRLVGTTLLAGGEALTGYRILAIEGRRAYVRRGGEGVDALPAERFELIESAYLAAE